ncbi:MAG: ATP-binding protein, partial [Bacteroidales bacterium]|nr:ATP-binding protein [Bacteroidales bacterium]
FNEDTIIKISDNGIGIDKKDLSQITDPFFTTKPPGEGTGLGLSITYSIIKDHHGTIEFESEIKKGTTVTITLPIKYD